MTRFFLAYPITLRTPFTSPDAHTNRTVHVCIKTYLYKHTDVIEHYGTMINLSKFLEIAEGLAGQVLVSFLGFRKVSPRNNFDFNFNVVFELWVWEGGGDGSQEHRREIEQPIPHIPLSVAGAVHFLQRFLFRRRERQSLGLARPAPPRPAWPNRWWPTPTPTQLLQQTVVTVAGTAAPRK